MSDTLRYQGRWLLQIGVALFLFTSFDGFAVPHFAVPNLGRSVHTLSAFVGVLFVAMGLVWPTLELGARAARTAFWLLIYSAFATIAAFLIAGVWAPAVRSSRWPPAAYVGAICRRP
jgi:hydroxylaminobenzene mutase